MRIRLRPPLAFKDRDLVVVGKVSTFEVLPWREAA